MAAPTDPFRAVLTPLFRTWWRMSRSMTLGVRGLATDEAGRVLLVRHTYTAGWHLPGGGVEHGETALEALTREMAEEGGIAIGETALHGFFSNHEIFRNDHVVIYRVLSWTPAAHDSVHEIAERGFFAADALPEGVTPGTQRRIAEALHGAPLSTHW